MSYSAKELRVFVEKIAKQVLQDESNKIVVDGIITEACAGYYGVHLSKSSEDSDVTATSLYTEKTFNKDDHVYLVEATISTGDDKDATYFIVGLVDAVDTQFFNLTEAERFLGDGVVKKVSGGEIVIDPAANEADAAFINALRKDGVMKFSANVSSKVNSRKDFGFEFVFTLDDYSAEIINFSHEFFVGQPWSMNHVTQTKIFTFEKENKIKNVKVNVYTEHLESDERFEVHNMSLECGTLLNVVQDFTVSVENVTGKTYFNKGSDSGSVQLKATVNYGNQKLDTKYLKYYWFVEDENVVKPGPTETNKLESIFWEGAFPEQIPFNPLLGSGWRCLNKGEFAHTIDNNGNIVENPNVSLYETTSNIITLEKGFSSNFENKVKCVVTYQLAQAESEPFIVYDFDHEQYEVVITKTAGPDILIGKKDKITLEAALINPISVLSTEIEKKLEFYWVKGGFPSDWTPSKRFKKGRLLEVSGEVVKEDTEFTCICCHYEDKDKNEYEIFGYASYEIQSLAGSTESLEYKENKLYWNSEQNNLRFVQIPSEDETYNIYVTESGEEGIENPEEFNDEEDELEVNVEYFLYCSTQEFVVDVNDKDKIVRIQDYSLPKIIKHYKIVDGEEVILSSQGALERLNSFNELTDGGRAQGIQYQGATYETTEDTQPDEIKLKTGKGYYKKIDAYEYQLVKNISSFEEGVEYYTKDADGVYTKATEYQEGINYYIYKLTKTDYILRPQDESNYIYTDGEITGFISGQEYYEQEGGDLYINASYINSGAINVEGKFCADMENPKVEIGGYTVSSSSIQSEDGKVGMSSTPGRTNDYKDKYAFWAGGTEGEPVFYVTHDGSAKVSGSIAIEGDSNLVTDDDIKDLEKKIDNINAAALVLGIDYCEPESKKHPYAYIETENAEFLYINTRSSSAMEPVDFSKAQENQYIAKQDIYIKKGNIYVPIVDFDPFDKSKTYYTWLDKDKDTERTNGGLLIDTKNFKLDENGTFFANSGVFSGQIKSANFKPAGVGFQNYGFITENGEDAYIQVQPTRYSTTTLDDSSVRYDCEFKISNQFRYLISKEALSKKRDVYYANPDLDISDKYIYISEASCLPDPNSSSNFNEYQNVDGSRLDTSFQLFYEGEHKKDNEDYYSYILKPLSQTIKGSFIQSAQEAEETPYAEFGFLKIQFSSSLSFGYQYEYGVGQGGCIDFSDAPKIDFEHFSVGEDGSINATAGQIGGFHITSSHLASGDTKGPHQVMISPGWKTGAKGVVEDGYCFWAGDGEKDESRPFWVKTDGTIYATKGEIGGCKINNGKLEIKAANIIDDLSASSIEVSNRDGFGSLIIDSNQTYLLSIENKLASDPSKPSFNPGNYSITADATSGMIFGGVNGGAGIQIHPVDEFSNGAWKITTLNTEVDAIKEVDKTVLVEGDFKSRTQMAKLWGDWYIYQLHNYQGWSDELHTGQIWSDSGTIQKSDRLAKNSIQEPSEQYSVLFDNLKPVTFKMNNGTSGRTHTGFIAQDLEQAAIDSGLSLKDFAAVCCSFDEDGNKFDYGVRYEELIPLCVDQIQKLKTRVSELEAKLNII